MLAGNEITHLRQAVLKGRSTAICENAFRIDAAMYAGICVLVDQNSQFGLDFELDSSVGYLSTIGVAHNLHEQEVGNRFGELLQWLDVDNAGLPGTKHVVSCGLWRWWRNLRSRRLR